MSPADARIADAVYDEPTDRYPHRVLGDRSEMAALRITLADGAVHVVRWPPGMVFEDTAPRIVDLDGDGSPEVVVVESSATEGARIAVYGLVDGAVVLRAATAPIGQRFRWIAVAAVSDLNGDGHIEIAAVDRPHLARVLRVWRWQDGALLVVAERAGVTNHRIGEPDIAGGLRDCGAGPEIVAATPDWSAMLALRLGRDNHIAARRIGPVTGEAGFAAALACAAGTR